MRKTETRDIDGYTFTVQQLGAFRAQRVMHKIVSTAGPAFLKAGGTNGGKLADMDLSALSDAVQVLMDRLSAVDLEQLQRELFEVATVTAEGSQHMLLKVYDDFFAGKLMLAGKVTKFALEVNFGDFFGAFAASLPSAANALSSPSASKSIGPAIA